MHQCLTWSTVWSHSMELTWSQKIKCTGSLPATSLANTCRESIMAKFLPETNYSNFLTAEGTLGIENGIMENTTRQHKNIRFVSSRSKDHSILPECLSQMWVVLPVKWAASLRNPYLVLLSLIVKALIFSQKVLYLGLDLQVLQRAVKEHFQRLCILATPAVLCLPVSRALVRFLEIIHP